VVPAAHLPLQPTEVASVGDQAFVKFGKAFFKCDIVEWDGASKLHRVDWHDRRNTDAWIAFKPSSVLNHLLRL
jgi:hypothetical protein